METGYRATVYTDYSAYCMAVWYHIQDPFHEYPMFTLCVRKIRYAAIW